METIKIGVVGLGTVGTGVVKCFKRIRKRFQKLPVVSWN